MFPSTSCRAWNMFFFPFLPGNAYVSYRIQAWHSSINQNMEQVERGISHWEKVRVNRLAAQPQVTTRWRLTVWSWGSLYMLTCYFSYLEIHSFFENTTVNTEERRKGHCEGKLNPLSLLIREHSRIHAVDHVKLVYHIREQIESLTSNKHSSYYFRMGFTNLPRIDCTRLINRIICENNTRNVIPRRDQRYQTDFFKWEFSIT